MSTHEELPFHCGESFEHEVALPSVPCALAHARIAPIRRYERAGCSTRAAANRREGAALPGKLKDEGS